MFLYAELLNARLVGNITALQTSITIDDSSTLPTLGSGQYFIVEMKQDNKREVMTCTAVVGNVLTVTRATYYPQTFRNNALCTISIDPYGYEVETGAGLTQAQTLSRLSIGF